MEEIFNWVRPILSGLAGGLFVWALVAFTKDQGKHEGSIRHLHYGKPFKIFALLLIPFSVFVVYAVSQSYKGQEIPAFLVALGFVSGAIFFPYQAFFVRFSYDDEFVYYKSPLVGTKKEPWGNLIDVGYSKLLQADFIVVDGIGKIWCSNMLNGYGELGEFLEKKVQELYPEQS
ncbi:hypothetical protein [Microbulbifer thermotolerans]|uniref:Uncharacterized protein n=1 Tax=Microbulbifer thermotolerans TaxID=252514 RepID=A0A143HND1_MICTH|nr:hypothetical protein [Microbulbifer thermotolerans]AMX03007.1 hypothetical protein A3224_10895 [Microbulbifer thermotolerans]MCX2833149.1 hypothetical protein [Microbulbifer thermotolerans]SFC70968.1 hypothetical protein SAMN05660479_02236 [Microbulbifer thermotolerans]